MAGWIRRAFSGRYQARYRTPGGRTRSKTFDRRKDAEKWLRRELAPIDRGDWIDPDAGTLTLAEWAGRWMATRLHIRDSTRERDETYLRSLILPHFGTRRLCDVTRHDIQDWVAGLAEEGYAAATIQLAYGLVSMAFNAAADDALVQHTPCADVNLPKRIETEKRFLSVDELHDLADTIDPATAPLSSPPATPGHGSGNSPPSNPETLTSGGAGSRSPAHLPKSAVPSSKLNPRHLRRNAQSRSPKLLPTTSPHISTTTARDAPIGCSPHPKADRYGAAASGNVSGSPPWTHPSANPCGSMT